jgi:hypothetical protein
MKSDSDFPQLKILDLTVTGDVALLTNELAQNDRDRLPSGQILNIVLPDSARSIGCRSVVVEEDYVDRNFAKAYAQFYSRAFHDFQRRTKRFHFFSTDVQFSDFLTESNLQSSYLGFCILSPSEPRTLGRTVIGPPKSELQEYVTCQDEFSVNLAGVPLKARGAPFIEQDGRVAACATAALWSAVMVASRKFDEISSASTNDITELARKYTLGPSGYTYSPGLNLEQMLWALKELGCAPLKYTFNDHLAAKELIYTYVESQLPPVLVVRLPNIDSNGFHALTVIGHTYDKSFSPPQHMPMTYNYYYSTNEWCPEFVIHCDQNGPYHHITINAATSKSGLHPVIAVNTVGLTSEQAMEISEFYKDAELWAAVIPLPSRVFLKAEEAAAKGRALVGWAYALHKTALLPERPVYRTYLMPSNDFKRRLVPGKVPGLSEHLAKLYRGTLLPRYVWVTELYDLKQKVGLDPEGLRIVAEAVVDATSSPLWLDFVLVHIPNLFMHMTPVEHDPVFAMQRTTVVQGDSATQPLIRLDCQNKSV